MKPALLLLAALSAIGCSGLGYAHDPVNCYPNGVLPDNPTAWECTIQTTCAMNCETYYEFAYAPSKLDAEVCLQSLLASGYEASDVTCVLAGGGKPNAARGDDS